MTQTLEPTPPRLPDDALPPVEPPSAGFILQLFVVPAVIVAIVVAIWLMFNWLAHMGDNPESYVHALKRENAARWQAAVNLANALRRSGSPLRSDSRLAAQLSQMLHDELTAPRKGDEADVRVRVYLCRALGEFNVPTGLPTLLTAATQNRGESDVPVRASALEGISLLASGAAGEEVRASPDVLPAVVACSRDDDTAIRSRAAFALGVLGGEEAIERLDQLLHDPYPDVRYNAATGLARHGDARAVDVLAEMLDPQRVQLSEEKNDEVAKGYKRPIIQQNALRAAEKLAKANSTSDLGALRAAAERLAGSDVDRDIRAYAEQVAHELARRTVNANKESAFRPPAAAPQE
jgi:HEAT repeat protein